MYAELALEYNALKHLIEKNFNTNLMIKYFINKLNYLLFGLGKKYKYCHSYGAIF